MRPQFTIRALMIGTLVFACVFGGVVWDRQQTQRRTRQRQEAVDWLENVAGPVSYYGPDLVYEINFNRKRLDKATWARLSFLTEARTLWLDATNLTGTDLQRLSRFQRLELLSLCDTHLTDAELQPLLRLPKLEQLYLTGTGITSDGIETISRLPRLVNLSIANTKVDDEAIPALIKMKQLRKLNVNSTSISADGLSQLRHAMPNCRVTPTPRANKAVNRRTQSRGN